MSGVRVEARTADPRAVYQTDRVVDRRHADYPAVSLVVGAAAVALPFVVVPAWYDAYYWPKVCVLYVAVAVGALCMRRSAHASWSGDLGAPLAPALTAWLAALAIATGLSINPMLSFVGEDYRYEGLLTWAAYAALAALSASALRSPRRLEAVLGWTLAAAGGMSVLALLQHAGLTPVPVDVARRTWVRAWGTTGSPLALGAYLVLLFPLILSLYTETRRSLKMLYATLAVAMYAALIATDARADWGALALGVIAWSFAAGKGTVRRAAGSLALLAAICAVVTPAVLFSGPPGVAGHVADANSATSRLFLWRTSAPLVAARPLFGWGPDTLAQAYPVYKTPEFVRVFPEAGMQRIVVDRPHNDLLQQAIATGLVGLAAYVWLSWTILGIAWRTARARVHGDHGLRRGDDRHSPLVDPAIIGAGLFGGFVAYFAQLQLSFSYVSVAPLFWVLVGAVAALRPRVAWGTSMGRPIRV
ncbi:MAG TPA: O-antigen ligase family protein [bacterium]|nr:O-antigen ligase family protein [bacterium]